MPSPPHDHDAPEDRAPQDDGTHDPPYEADEGWASADERSDDAPDSDWDEQPASHDGPDDLPLNDPARGIRLQRYLADAGLAARRACEKLIADGRVEVNGDPVMTLPIFVNPEIDRIRVDGKIVGGTERLLYLMLNKPPHTLSAVMDEPGSERRTVLDLVDHPSRARLFPVGRLDYDTLGLMLLTNDGELANRLTHPRFGVAKTYHAVVKGRLENEDTERLEQGIYLAERKQGHTVGAVRTSRVQVSIFRRDRERTILEITLKEGRNRQVRRMLAKVGCPVKKLERVAMGPLRLKGVARGEWRELTSREVAALRRAAGISGKRTPGSGPMTAGGGKMAQSPHPSARGGRNASGQGGRGPKKPGARGRP